MSDVGFSIVRASDYWELEGSRRYGTRVTSEALWGMEHRHSCIGIENRIPSPLGSFYVVR